MEIADYGRRAGPRGAFGRNQIGRIDLEMSGRIGSHIICQLHRLQLPIMSKQQPAAFPVIGLLRPIEQLCILLP